MSLARESAKVNDIIQSNNPSNSENSDTFQVEPSNDTKTTHTPYRVSLTSYISRRKLNFIAF